MVVVTNIDIGTNIVSRYFDIVELDYRKTEINNCIVLSEYKIVENTPQHIYITETRITA